MILTIVCIYILKLLWPGIMESSDGAIVSSTKKLTSPTDNCSVK